MTTPIANPYYDLLTNADRKLVSARLTDKLLEAIEHVDIAPMMKSLSKELAHSSFAESLLDGFINSNASNKLDKVLADTLSKALTTKDK